MERGLTWDEILPPDLLKSWKKWSDKLKALQDLRIDVCVKPADDYESIQLHIFVDAAKGGYGTCCYVRVDYKDHIRVTLVTSKGRVCPRKPLSIIRLELQAAVTGSRLARTVLDSLDEIQFGNVVLWSASHVFLAYDEEPVEAV